MITVGIISDTHGYLDPSIRSYFESCDEIWHAGDIGGTTLLDSLKKIKPVYGVYGNVDGQDIRVDCPEDLWLNREGLRILLTHIAGRPGKYTKRVKETLKSSPADILICGHSHILKVQKDPAFNNMWYINPGAAGKQGFHHKKTIMRMSLQQGEITNLEVIDLGKRGSF